MKVNIRSEKLLDYTKQKLLEFNQNKIFIEKEKKQEPLRKQFVEDFPISKIYTMTKEEYVEGFRQHTFCNRIEHDLVELGEIRGTNTWMFGIWYGVHFDDKERKYRITSKFAAESGDIDESFDNIKLCLIELLAAGSSLDIQAIEDNNFAPTLKGKILFLYYPDKFLSTYSEEYLKYFAKSLNIKYAENESTFRLQQKILAWKNSTEELKGLSNFLFNEFLYFALGNPKEDNYESIQRKIEELEDINLIDSLKDNNNDSALSGKYDETLKKPAAPVYNEGHKVYPRDRKTALNALKIANYQCEIEGCTTHLFLRKSNGLPYTEPHHLIPMAASDDFPKASLDREQNIVSLCSNCHNEIHYGKESEKLIKQLFEKRKNMLEKIDIRIDLDKLKKYY